MQSDRSNPKFDFGNLIHCAVQLAPVYPLLYKVLKPAFPGCLWSGRSDVKAIALTIDDGPHPAHTLPLLKVLDDYHTQANFFG